MVAQAHHRLHDMLDHQHRDAGAADVPDDRNDGANLGRVEAGEHLVEQQQLRLGGERAREFEPFAAGEGEARGGRVEAVGKPDEGRDRLSRSRAPRRGGRAADGRRPRYSRAR